MSQFRSLTPTIYTRVGDLFRERFGDRAGWAHSLLFAAELPGFKVNDNFNVCLFSIWFGVECLSCALTPQLTDGNLADSEIGCKSQLATSGRIVPLEEPPCFDVQAMLSPEMQKEMDEFKRQERDAKAESKAEKTRGKKEKSSKSTQKAKQVKRGDATRSRGRATR